MNRLKRKPYILGIAAAALVLGLAAWQFARPSKAESPRLERFLPADAVGFVQVNDLRAQALRVIESEAWREFSRENAAASSLFMMAANHAGVLDASYAVALLGADAEGPQFVLVAEFSDGGARRTFENRVLRLVREANQKGITTRSEQHGEVTVNTVAPAERKGFAYAQARNLLFLSNTPEAVKRVLDVREGKAPSLETSQTFAQARARARYADGMFGFLDGAALARMVDAAQAAAGAHPGVEAFRQFFHGTGASGVQSVAFTSVFEDGRVSERFAVVAPNRQGVLGTIASNPPTPQALLALVPEDASQVFDASVAHAPQTFDEMLALADQAAAQAGRKSLGDVLAEFADKTGVSLRDDIVRSLGAEVCRAQFPVGERLAGVLILSVRDEQAFASTLEKFAAHGKRATSAREYRGVTIRSIAGENGRGLDYAFVGGNFVSSDDEGGVERVIDTAQGGASLRASAAYQAASAGLAGQPQFVYYNTNADYLNRLGRMLPRSEQEFKTEGQRATLRPSFAFGVAQPEGFYVESRTPLGTFPRLLTAVTSKLGVEKQEGEAEKKTE